MSQIEGQQITDDTQVAVTLANDTPVEPEYASEEERMFAEEFEIRAAEERGEAPRAEAPPAEEPPAEEPPAEELSAEELSAKKPPWYAELSEEAKLAFDEREATINQLQWQYTAVHGRLAPVQAQVEKLTRQLSEGQPATPVIPGGQPTPIASTPQDFESKEFLAFAEDYPEEATAMKALFASQQGNVQRLEQQVHALSQGLEQVQHDSSSLAMQNELQVLTERHPDWMLVRQSPQFDSWLQTQPPSVQPMVNSKLASDCSYLLDRYKQDVYLYELSQGIAQQGTPAVPAAPSEADKTVQHRRTLLNAPTPDPQGGGTGVPGVTTSPQTAEAMWVEELDRRLRAQKNQR